jgi:peptidoglycan hydrolase-like protein with peptidoglycan-binding domain
VSEQGFGATVMESRSDRTKVGLMTRRAPKRGRGRTQAVGLFVGVSTLAFLAASCGSHNSPSTGSAAAGSPPAAAASTAPSTSPPATALPTTGAPPTTVSPTAKAATAPAPKLEVGGAGPAVLALQKRLTALHYWVGTLDGNFGDSTEQAVYAFQKAAGLQRDGVVGPKTEAALVQPVEPQPRSRSGYVIEIDLSDDLMMFVSNGKLDYVLNTSTGGGYTYTTGGETAVADTPIGVFHISRQVDGMVTDSLGQLWRPKFFYSGFAIHGDGYVPPYPVSHGCARVSNEAIDWIWATGQAPIGTEVWVY